MTEEKLWDAWEKQASSTEKAVHHRLGELRLLFSDITSLKNTLRAADLASETVPSWQVENVLCEPEHVFDHVIIRVESIPKHKVFPPHTMAMTTIEPDPTWPLTPLCSAVHILPDFVQKDSVLLHEMLHIVVFRCFDYEHAPSRPIPAQHIVKEEIQKRLHADLKTKIKGLERGIKEYTGSPVKGHDLFFLLKSLDLDLRIGYPFGTVMGYGSAERFSYMRNE